jgi:uncharacterized protein
LRTPWLSNIYSEYPEIVTIERDIRGKKYYILLNPDVGSWMVLQPDEYTRYKNKSLSEIEYESLYLRNLALDSDGEKADFVFPAPAEYPSVVVVNITTFCNLRCLYCFANCEEASGANMTEEVMSRAIEEMLRMPSDTITFEIQGGEPLYFIDGIEKFILIAEKLNKEYKKIIKYRTVTNATLINDYFIDLVKKYHIAVGVSLDGPKELTDKVRVYADGQGAFDDIWAGIEKARAAGITIDGAVCTLGQHNCDQSEQIVEFFC